jgi:DNA repair exonuclease SbcCD ATPase subunit
VTLQLEKLGERLDRLEEGLDRLAGKDRQLTEIQTEARSEFQNKMGELQTDLGGVGSSLQGFGVRLLQVEENVGDVNSRLGEAGLEVMSLKRDHAESLRLLREELSEAELRQKEALNALQNGVEDRVREELVNVTERIAGVREQLTSLLSQTEASIHNALSHAVDAKTAEVEAKLGKEIDQMVESVTEKMSELRGLLAHLEAVMPQREQLESVNELLGRLEGRVSRVAEQVEGLDSLSPDLRTLGQKLGALKDHLGAISDDLRQTGRGLGERLGDGFGGLKEGLARQLFELESLVEGGIHRWESDQSQMLERLGAIRDTLRDQFRDVAQGATSPEASLWGKLTGRKEGGLKLSKDDWERLSSKVEGVISGLESVLARKKEGP